MHNKVIPIWQPLGFSTYRLTNAVARYYGEKATHTGVLDPFAQGVIVVLTGDKRYEKLKYSDCIKGYEFDITFGLSTDSYDGMGLLTNCDFNTDDNNLNKNNISTALKSFIGENYVQTVPLYSGKKVEGKKLFMYPKDNLPNPKLPLKKGTIYKLELKKLTKVSAHNLIVSIIANVKNINIGDFRQTEIIKSWEDFLKTIPENLNLYTASIYAETSKGIYVRSLSQDISEKLKTSGFVTRLVRLKNGKFTKKDCVNADKFLL